MAAYIPTNLISITDGQIYVTPTLFQKGILPAVDVGKSVSRVGGKTQLAAYHAVGGALRLFYSQFEELEVFSRFGTRLDEHTRQTLARGQSVRESLKQAQYDPMSPSEQIAVLLAASSGIFDNLSSDEVVKISGRIREALPLRMPGFTASVAAGSELEAGDREALLAIARSVSGVAQSAAAGK
jgi:F-type H+-transporting ATPase subunit alpha